MRWGAFRAGLRGVCAPPFGHAVWRGAGPSTAHRQPANAPARPLHRCTAAPQYYVTEAEASILRRAAPDILTAAGLGAGEAARASTVIELGAG